MRLTLLVCASLADASVGQDGLACGSGMTRFAALREKQQALWRDQLQQRLHALASAEAPWSAALDGIWLFGSRARGDWDGWSDTDLIVVALDQQAADHWADRIAEAGIAADVIAMDRVRWQQLPTNPSALWRGLARDHGYLAQSCFFASQAAEKALKSALLELGQEPPHTHALADLVAALERCGLDLAELKGWPLRRLSRMAVSSRYPMDATPPSELFDRDETDQALQTAAAVIRILTAFDRQ